MNTKHILKITFTIALLLILSYFLVITAFKNYKEDMSLPAPKLTFLENKVSSENCKVAVYIPSGFGNFYFGSFEGSIGNDEFTTFINKDEKINNFFCSKVENGNIVYSNKFIEYNIDTKAQVEKNQNLIKKLFF